MQTEIRLSTVLQPTRSSLSLCWENLTVLRRPRRRPTRSRKTRRADTPTPATELNSPTPLGGSGLMRPAATHHKAGRCVLCSGQVPLGTPTWPPISPPIRAVDAPAVHRRRVIAAGGHALV